MPEDPVAALLSQPIKLQRTTAPVLSDTVIERRNNPVTYTPSQKLPYMTYDKLMAGSNDVYDPLDFPVVGQRIRDNVVKAIESRFPVVGEAYTLKVENVHYEKPKQTELREEKDVLLHEGTLQDRLKGDWVLYDNKTGKEIQRKKTTLLNVPRMTDRGTFIRNGAELGLKHMFRLRSGVYTHIKNNGQVSAHINPEQTTGQQMAIDLDQATGIFSVSRGTRTYGLLPLMKAAGVPDEAVKKVLGEDLYNVNYDKYKKMMDANSPVQEEYKTLWNESIAPIKLDPETTASTLGKSFDKMDPDVFLRASGRVLQVSKTMSDLDTDDRDSLRYQRIMGPADYIPERIVRDGGGLLRKLFNTVIKNGNLDAVNTGAFQPQVDSVFMDDKHAGYIDGSSPLESMDFAAMVSRIGEGGIGSLRAAPAETRAVNDSYINYIDSIRSPECCSADTEVLTKDGWRKISDIKFRDVVGGVLDGVQIRTDVLQMNEYDYDGELIGYDDGAVSFLVTPDHRLIFAEDEWNFKPRVVYAKDWNIEEDNKVYVPQGTQDDGSQLMGVWTLDKNKYFKQSYKGKVYCPTVFGGMIIVKRNNAKAGVLTGNSLKVGLDVYMTHGVMKDSAGNLYNKFKDKSGKVVVVPMNVAAASVVATPEFYDPNGDPNEFIPAMYQGKGIEYVKRKDVDFFVDNSNNMLSLGAGMIPLIGGIRSNRTLMGCLDPETSVVVVQLFYLDSGITEVNTYNITARELLENGYQKKDDIYLVSLDLGTPCFRKLRGVHKVTENLQLYEVSVGGGISCKVNGIHRWKCKVLETSSKDTVSYLTTEEIKKLMDEGKSVTIPYIETQDYKFLGNVLTATYGSGLVTDKVIKSIEPAGEAEYLVDIDVNDNVYLLSSGMFTHNSKYGNQAVPLTHGESPLVQRKLTLNDGEETTTERFIGRQLGARFAPMDGVITSVNEDSITMRGRDGQLHHIDLYNDYPANQKGYITSRTLVKPGDRVHANQILAATNYTDDEGTAALGTNLRVAFLTGRNAGTFEDSIQISETAAKTKLASTQLYKLRGETTDDIEYSKSRYLSLFKDDFTPEQLDKIDDNGLPKIGAVFEEGDPVYLGVQKREIGVHGLAKNAAVPYVTRWEHEDPGTVTNVIQGKKHLTVYTKCVTPMKVGDKLCFDSETEVLTDKGWKFFKDLNDTERVMTLELATGETYLTTYSEKFSYDYKGKMYSLKNEFLDICVTPDHRNIVTANTNTDYVRIMTSKEVFGRTVFHITGQNVLNPHNFKPSKTKQTKEEWIDYDGKVYCLTVPYTHTMFVRRHGKTWWSGNSARYGNKGVCGEIVPDDQMPRDSEGRPFDIIQSPLGIVSRLNGSQLAELQLAKIAQKTGKPYALPDFMSESIVDFTDNEMKKYGVEPDEDVYDPVTGKTIPNVQTGVLFYYKLKHMAEIKERSRSTGQYSSEDVPLKGPGAARRFGTMETSAVYSGGGMEVLRDAKIVRGQRNDEFWRDYRSGKYPETPGFPLVHQKFFAHLKAAGINLEDRGDRIHIYGATNSDLRRLTGDRQVTKAATYDSKKMQPVAGGLFDPTIFGVDGDQWGYVELPEPVLNPMMFKPIASILGWKDKELSEYLSGERKLDGKFGSQNLIDTLKKIDLPKELAKAKQVLKSQSTTLEQRDMARKRLRAIEPMLREGKTPEDFFVTRMPILPPRFRPVTEMSNGVGIAADINFLYKRAMDAIDDLVLAKKELPEELQLDARRELYNSLNAVTGLQPTDDPKLEAKGVAGVLRWAFGKGSPKLGSCHRKVFGANLDLGSLNVITPDNSLTIDQVGVPEPTAWKMFEPFVVRKLVQGGSNVINAMKSVLDQTPEARRALVEVMKNRPILINRAPTLWRYGIQGQYPVLVKGNALRINPNICKLMNADYDGNCLDFDSKIFLKLSKSALEILKRTMYINSNANPREERKGKMSVTKDSLFGMTLNGDTLMLSIGMFPKIGEPIKDKNGADVYGIPSGVEVLSADPVTGECGFYKATSYTVERDKNCVEVTIGSRKAIMSDNATLAVFDYNEGKVIKVPAAEHNKRLVPVFKKAPLPFGEQYNRDFGWWLGSLISDGWVTDRTVGYSKTEDIKRAEFIRIARTIHENFVAKEYPGDKNDGKLSDSVKVHLNGTDLAKVCQGFGIYTDEYTKGEDNVKSAIKKQIPYVMLHWGSEEFIYGLLSGLLDGDGSIVKNMTTGRPRFSCRFSTSSPALKESVEFLLYRLGIRYSTTVTPPRNWSRESYNICPSTVDMYPILNKLTCIGSREKELIGEWKQNPAGKDDKDIVPISRQELDNLRKAHLNGVSRSLYAVLVSKHYCTRAMGLEYADFIGKHAPEFLKRLRVTNTLWCPVNSVVEVGKRDVYDFAVPDTKLIVANNGIVVYDTMTTHVPVSNEAIKAIDEHMLPSRNLLSPIDNKAHFIPRSEFAQGLYLASRTRNEAPIRFKSKEDMMAALKRGEIKVDMPVIIG